MNSHANIFRVPKNQAHEVTNLRTNKKFGALSKREATIQSLDYGTTAINSLHRFYESDGTMKTIITTSTLVRADFDGTATTIRTNRVADGKRFQFVTYQDVAIGGNDTDLPIKYDGHTLTTAATDNARTVGELCAELGAPFAQISSENGGNDLDAESWYMYKVAFYDDTTYSYSTARSNPIKTGTVALTTQNLTITDVPLGPIGTTHRYIFRTVGFADPGGQAAVEATGTYKMVYDMADNSTTEWDDSIADGAEPDVPNWATVTGAGSLNATPPICPYWEIVNERVFGAGNTTYKSQIYWSDEYNPDYFDPVDYEEIRPDDGDEVTFLKTQLGVLMVGKTNTIQRFYTDAASDLDWYASDPFSFVGCPAPYSAANTPIGIFYLSWSGLYNFNGQNSQLVSDAVTDVINDISRSDIESTAGFYHENEYHLSYTSSDSGSPTNDRELIYNLVRDAYVVDTKAVNCYAAFNSGTDTGVLYFGSATADGWVFKYTAATSILKARYKSELDTGTYSDTMAYGLEANPTLSLAFLDIMEEYTNDTLAQAAWVSSDTALDSDADMLLHLDSDFTDTVGTHTPVATGATINTTYKKFGDGSCYFDGVNDYVTVPDHADWFFDTGDFSISAWVKFNPLPAAQYVIVAQGSTNDDGWEFRYAGAVGSYNLVFYSYEGGAPVVNTGQVWTPNPVVDTWYYVSVTRESDVFRFFVDGTQMGSDETDADSVKNFSDDLTIGCSNFAGNYQHDFNGYIDEVRITKGFARWTTDFTPQKHAYGSNTQCYAEDVDTYVSEGSFSLNLETIKTHSLNDTFSKTIDEIDLSSPASILIDVYASRSGTQFQFGIGESGGAFTDNLINVPVTAADTWETVTLDISGIADADINAVIYTGVKITNTDHDNMIYIDNIRPALTTGTWTSSTTVYEINAVSLNKLYWNELLGAYGDVTFEIRTGATTPPDGTWTGWTATPYTDPGGSVVGEAANTYIQFRVTLTTSDSEYTPYLYQADGYLFKMTYSKAGTAYESAVPSAWQSGWTNLDIEGYKKFIRRIKIFYHGTSGILVFNLKNEEGDINRDISINLSVGAADDPDDAYTGEGDGKIYTWYPAVNSETDPSPISELWWFTLSESGIVTWDVDKIQVMSQIEELYD